MARKALALVVEDEADTGTLLAEHLRRWGFDPTVMHEGEPAISWTHLHHPELILLDLMLPDIDGYDICENLKLDRQTNLVPIIMVTCRDQPQDRIHGLQVGANYYLTKPFTPEQLEQAIQEVNAWKEELIRHGTHGEIHFHMKSDTQALEELNFLLGALFLHSGMPEAQVKQLIMAVREMGSNAIESGHKNQIDRIVTVTYRIDGEKITIIVRDTGPGFNPHDLPHAAKPGDPIGHLELREKMGLREGGFGIMIARGLVDELQYNEKGNEVKLVKFFPPKAKIEDRESKIEDRRLRIED
jgi:CheY-like chemotaxis protein/anti-sigma regulatory factor (Ser/Thr protein kinase)